MNETVRIEKLVHGGQGIGTLADGRKAFVWNALPGELVTARIIKKKSSYVEAVAEEILEPSEFRIVPSEENYLATSPWQIVQLEKENELKSEIVTELFAREKVELPELGPALQAGNEWQYRNKMEYSFWGDDDGLHLALYRRGSHGKQIITGSKLAMPAIDIAANDMLEMLNNRGERASNLKTIIVRCSQNGRAVASLFVKSKDAIDFEMPKSLAGIRVYYSDPKSPASVPTKLLLEHGAIRLQDELLGKKFTYDVDSFFQVNIPVFEQALKTIQEQMQAPALTDMYAGVGSIGLSIAKDYVDLIELDPATAAMARINAKSFSGIANVIEASAEKAPEYIASDRPVVFDPPRAGLHKKVIERLLEVRPPQLVYLSCNPATQARDLKLLTEAYSIDYFKIFNFFPRTPHIESLAVLRLK